MADCVFCRIVAGELSAKTVWEDDRFMAILDIFPKIAGQIVLISKIHLPSDVFTLTDEQVTEFYLAAKKIAAIMNKALGTQRVAQSMEGLEVEHAHLKLYPVYSAGDYLEKSNKPPERIPDEELNKLFIKFQEGR